MKLTDKKIEKIKAITNRIVQVRFDSHKKEGHANFNPEDWGITVDFVANEIRKHTQKIGDYKTFNLKRYKIQLRDLAAICIEALEESE